MLEKTIDTGEVNIRVRDYGGDRSAAIFLHFGGGNMQMWRDVVPFFEREYRCVLLDLRGHGKSDKPEEGYHIDQLAEDVIAVMDALGIEGAHIIGSSLGAEVGISLAARHAGRVLSIVCEGALFNEGGPYGLFAGTDEEYQEYAQKTLHNLKTRPLPEFASIDEVVTDSEATFSKYGWWSDGLEAVVRYDANLTPDGKWVKSWDRIAHAYMRHALNYNFGDYYARIVCPILLLPDTYPGQDKREVEIMQALFDLIKDGKIVYVPEWVHPFGWMITPESVSETILDFLREL